VRSGRVVGQITTDDCVGEGRWGRGRRKGGGEKRGDDREGEMMEGWGGGERECFQPRC
jgi:hypothetical protein